MKTTGFTTKPSHAVSPLSGFRFTAAAFRLPLSLSSRLAVLAGVALILVLSGAAGWAQTWPAAFDLSTSGFTFGGFAAGTTTTYPASMQGHVAATIYTTSTLTTAPSGDAALNNSSTSVSTGCVRNEVANGISMLASGTTQVGDIMVAVNTTGRNTVKVTWTAAQVNDTTTRVNGARLQYRIGTSGSFTDVASTEYLTTLNGTASAQTFTDIALPSTVDNQSVVQLRWVYYDSSGSGGRDRIRIDDITVASLAVETTPSAPTATAATNITSSGFSANWNFAATATGYRLDVSTVSDFSSFVLGYSNLDVGNVTSTNVTGLSASTAYHYRVRAYNAGGTSGNSGTIDVTTSGGGTPKITVTLPGQSAANIGTPLAQTAGTGFDITLTATTDGTTTNTSFNSTPNITFSGPTGSPTYPSTVTFSSGVGTAHISLTKAEATTITATDTSDSIAGAPSSSLTVNPGAIDNYIVTASSPQTVGVAFNVSVTAKDAYGNTVTTDSSTSVTMGSGSGNVTFAGNPKTLVSGAFTISATDNTAETTTITATDGNSKTGSTGSIVVNPIPIYRSKASGNWNSTATWEYSTDNGSSWANAVATPTSADGTITILHLVTNSTAGLTVDQVVVASGGTLSMPIAFTVNDGAGDDIFVQNGGVFLLNSSTSGTAPGWTSGSTAKIETGGILRVTGSGLTSAGTGVNASNFIYQNGSILECGATPASSSVTYFPNADANTIPVFRLITIQNIGAGTPTTFNGVFEVASGITSTWQNAGTKTLRNGIRGSGTMNQSGGGPLVISGATADLGGSGTLTLGANGLLIASGSLTKLSSDKTVSSGVITNAGTLDINGKTLTLNTAPVFSGTNLTEIDNSASPKAGKIVLSSGTLTYGGVLTVTNIGATLTGGEVFDLFDASAFSGSFSATNLPGLSGGLNWYLGKLTVDGSIKVNRAPVATSDTITRSGGTSGTKVSLATLLANDTDADTDTLSITAVASTSAQGASLLNTNGYVFYTTGSAIDVNDSFTYTVSDGFGGTATGTVNVNVAAHEQARQLTSVTAGAGSFYGIPETSYTVQYTDSLSPANWQTLTTVGAEGVVTTSTNGFASFTDPSPPEGERFYRITYP